MQSIVKSSIDVTVTDGLVEAMRKLVESNLELTVQVTELISQNNAATAEARKREAKNAARRLVQAKETLDKFREEVDESDSDDDDEDEKADRDRLKRLDDSYWVKSEYVEAARVAAIHAKAQAEISAEAHTAAKVHLETEKMAMYIQVDIKKHSAAEVLADAEKFKAWVRGDT